MGAAEAQDVRVIAPGIVAPPPVAPEALERVRPREPLSELAVGAGMQSEKPDRLFKPMALAAGRMSVAGREIALASIEIIDAERVCDAGNGGTWPCGRHARTAFRLWLRGRALACHLADEEAGKGTAEIDVVRCTVGGQDAAAWLVARGWALAAPGGPYEELEEEARVARRGVFGGGP